MSRSKVIRIDDEVWVELQRRARPLEDTPNTVLRRVLDLPEASTSDERVDHRMGKLLELVHAATGEKLQLTPATKGYALLSAANEPVAFIRSRRERLRVMASKQCAQDAGLSDWQRERSDSPFKGSSVCWYFPDEDASAYREAAALLAKLWQHSAKGN